MKNFNAQYYERNHQLGDRPALWFYARLVRCWLAPGPVLDFGCGTGFLLRRLHAHISVAGLELSSYCRERLSDELPEISIHEDVSSLPGSTFSGIVALHVFEHIPDCDLTGILKRLHESLLPDGKLLCVMPDADGRGRRIKGNDWSAFKDPTHVNLKSSREWQDFFTQHGFRVLRVGTDGLWNFPYHRQWPVWVDYSFYAWGTVFQFLLGRMILPVGSGESVILLLQRDS